MLANTILPPFGYGQFLIIGIEMEKIELAEMIEVLLDEGFQEMVVTILLFAGVIVFFGWALYLAQK